jgi:hypothetical protein
MSQRHADPVDGGYIVKRSPGRVHSSFGAAGAEAARLSRQNPGPPFMVLKVVGVAQVDGHHG